jgi:hypothetical protein
MGNLVLIPFTDAKPLAKNAMSHGTERLATGVTCVVHKNHTLWRNSNYLQAVTMISTRMLGLAISA